MFEEIQEGRVDQNQMRRLDVPKVEGQHRRESGATDRELSDFMEGTMGTVSSNLERCETMTG